VLWYNVPLVVPATQSALDAHETLETGPATWWEVHGERLAGEVSVSRSAPKSPATHPELATQLTDVTLVVQFTGAIAQVGVVRFGANSTSPMASTPAQ